jgi:mannitol/fructose-specific phosphotransferase system IIA component
MNVSMKNNVIMAKISIMKAKESVASKEINVAIMAIIISNNENEIMAEK